jgi:hypothetical protein
MFYRGNSTKNLFYLYTKNDGVTLSAQYQIPARAQTGLSPAVAVFNNKIWLFYRGVNSSKFYT